MINRLRSWLLPSIADVFFVSILLYLVLPHNKELLGDGDTGYHIRAGEYILNSFSIPKSDIFSFITPTLPWTAHEWLSEVFMAFLHQLGGLTAVVIAFSLMIAATIRIFLRNIRSEGNNILLSIIASITFVALAKVHWLARPHIFSLVIILIWYHLLDDFQYRNKNRLWLLPLLMVLWVNLHGGFIIGLVVLGIYFAGNFLCMFTDSKQWLLTAKDKTLTLAKILGSSTIVCLVNPIGYNIFMFPFNLISNKFIMDVVSEFQSPNFHEIQPFKYILLFTIIIFAYSKRKPNLIEVALIVLFTSMSLYSVRYIPIFAVIVVPILLRYIEYDWMSSLKPLATSLRQRIENISLMDDMAKGYFWPALTLIIIIIIAVNGTITHTFDPEKKPVTALEFLNQNHVAGNMFNNDEFGDFVIYTSNNNYKVFIDGRGDMYGSKIIKEYCGVKEFETGWESILDKYKITWIFYDTNSVFSRFLINRKDWKLIYSDKVASIFVKDIPLYEPLINKFSRVTLAISSPDIANDKI